MNSVIKKLADDARFTDQLPPPTQDEVLEEFAKGVAQHCVSVFYDIWYEQGLDICGADFNCFLKEFNKRIWNES